MSKTVPTLEHQPLTNIVPHPDNVRRTFNEAEIKSLAVSIGTVGLLQALVVQSDPELGDGTVQLINGERRWRALKMLEAGTVPIPLDSPLDLNAIPVSHHAANGSVLDKMIAENTARVDLSPIEEAAGYKTLLEQGLSQADVGRAVGKSGTVISRRVKLLNLSPELRAAIDAGKISLAIADQLASLDVEVANALYVNGDINGYSLGQAIRKKEEAEAQAKLTKKLIAQGYLVGDFEIHPQGYGLACVTPAPKGTSWSQATYELEEDGEKFETEAFFESVDELTQAFLPSDDVMVRLYGSQIEVYTAVKLPPNYVVDPFDSTDLDYVDPDGPAEPADPTAVTSADPDDAAARQAKYKADAEKREAKDKKAKAQATAEARHQREQHDIIVAKPPAAAVLTDAAFAYVIGRTDQNTRARAAKMLNLEAKTKKRQTGWGDTAKTVDYQDWIGAFDEAWAAATGPEGGMAMVRKMVYAALLANAELQSWSAQEYMPVLEAAQPIEAFDAKAWGAEYTKKLKAKEARAAAKTEAETTAEGDED